VKRILAGVVVAAMLSGTALAGPSQEGWATYQRADYETALRLWRLPLPGAFSASCMTAAKGYRGILAKPSPPSKETRERRAISAVCGRRRRDDYVQAYMWASLAATRFPASAK
jgi:hypothetical protein